MTLKSKMPDNIDTLDVLWGAEEIAQALNLNPRRLRHMASKGDLPVGKVRGRLFAFRERLFEHLDRLSQRGQA